MRSPSRWSTAAACAISRRRPWTFSPEFGRQARGVRARAARARRGAPRSAAPQQRARRARRGAGADRLRVGRQLPTGRARGALLLPLLGLADRWAVRKWRRRLSDYALRSGGAGGGASDGAARSEPTHEVAERLEREARVGHRPVRHGAVDQPGLGRRLAQRERRQRLARRPATRCRRGSRDRSRDSRRERGARSSGTRARGTARPCARSARQAPRCSPRGNSSPSSASTWRRGSASIQASGV